MKKLKIGLSVVLVLALVLMPMLVTAEDTVECVEPMSIIDEAVPMVDAPLCAGEQVNRAYSNPYRVDTSDQTGAELNNRDALHEESDQVVYPEPDAEYPDLIPEVWVAPETDGEDDYQGATDLEVEATDERHLQTVDERTDYNLALAQFVQSADFGLFLADNTGKLARLDGRTLTLGEAYTLAVRFRIDAPVKANVEYSYGLPAVLVGKGDAAPRTFSYSAGDIATCRVIGNEVRVVFTVLAEEVTKGSGQAFDLTYTFVEKLNAIQVGDYTSFDITMPMANGYDAFTIHIAGHAKQDEAAEPETKIKPEAESEAETLDEAEVPVIEAEQVEATEDGVAEEEIAVVEAEREQSGEEHTAPYRYEVKPVSVQGDPLTFHADMSAYEGMDVSVQWQCNQGDGWRNAPGDSEGPTYYTVVNELNANCDWRALVIVHNAAQTDASAEAAPAA